jgi:hypothetical protein
LRIRHWEVQLVSTALDGIPAGEPAGEVDISGQTEISWVDDLICRGVVENFGSLAMPDFDASEKDVLALAWIPAL